MQALHNLAFLYHWYQTLFFSNYWKCTHPLSISAFSSLWRIEISMSGISWIFAFDSLKLQAFCTQNKCNNFKKGLFSHQSFGIIGEESPRNGHSGAPSTAAAHISILWSVPLLHYPLLGLCSHHLHMGGSGLQIKAAHPHQTLHTLPLQCLDSQGMGIHHEKWGFVWLYKRIWANINLFKVCLCVVSSSLRVQYEIFTAFLQVLIPMSPSVILGGWFPG